MSLGGTAATGVTVVSSTSITATTAAHAAGAVNVVVTNTRCADRHVEQRLYLHSSNPAPTVASITPNTGTAGGGTSVTITGTGFLAGATVSLGGTAATGVNVVEQHVDHCDDAGARRRCGERGSDQHRCSERDLGEMAIPTAPAQADGPVTFVQMNAASRRRPLRRCR